MSGTDTGRQSMVRTQQIDAATAENYRGTFVPDRPELGEGESLPPGWEGLYFPFSSPIDGLRPDGTPQDDGLAEVDLPRRLYAGEETRFHLPLHIGQTVEQRTSLGQVTEKSGTSGRLVFADIHRQYLVEGELCVESIWHDVFLPAEAPEARLRPAETDPSWWSTTITPDSRHLFRFSAITFNSHRVHYDRAWAREAEGLEDLLVHGPLTRILLLDAALAHHPGQYPREYRFTATAPLFVDRAITLTGRDDDGAAEAVAVNDRGELAATGRVEW